MTAIRKDDDMQAIKQHWSDCAVHNAPALEAEGCTCGGFSNPTFKKPAPSTKPKEVKGSSGGVQMTAGRALLRLLTAPYKPSASMTPAWPKVLPYDANNDANRESKNQPAHAPLGVPCVSAFHAAAVDSQNTKSERAFQ